MKNKRNTTTYVRKEFFRRLLFLGLGIVPILLLLDKEGVERYIGVAGLLFSLYQLICIISMSQLIIDDFFPPKTPIETRSKPFDRFMYLFAGIFFFSALIFEVVEIYTIDNTINGMKLFWLSGLVGIVIAIILTVILKITNPSVYFESSRRYTVHFGLFAGCFLFSTAAAGFINHFFADKEITCKTYTVIRKSTGGKSNNEFWIFINTAPGKKERLDVSKQLYNSIADNGQIELCTRKGKLGYDVVDEILPANW